RFNAQQRANTQMRNVGSANDAQLYNLQQKQRIADANVDVANRQQDANVGAVKSHYGMRADKAAAVANALTGQATNLQKQAQNTRDTWANIGKGASQGMASLGQYM